MEFKKPRRHSSGQQKTTSLRRGDTTSAAPSPRRSAAYEKNPPSHSNDITQPKSITQIYRQQSFNKKTISIVIIVMAIVTIGIANLLPRQQTTTKNSAASSKDKNAEISDFKSKALIPQGKSIDKLGGWKRISPPNGDSVFTFTDNINTISIAVSQQILPESFKDNIDSRVANLAKQYNATATINTNGTKVYIGTSSKGPQSVIFTKNGLLVLIKSQKKITDKAWIDYVESLTPIS